MTDRHLVSISAGLSRPSSTTLLANRLTEKTVRELEALGVTATTRTVELREHAHAIVDAMATGFASGELAGVLDSLAAADGVVLTTPLFTTTYSGLFKSFIDILEPNALAATPVVLGATGGTPRHSLALEYSMRPLLTYLHADVVTTSVFAATDDWAAPGSGLSDRIARAARELAERVALRKNTGPADPFASAPSLTDLLGQ